MVRIPGGGGCSSPARTRRRPAKGPTKIREPRRRASASASAVAELPHEREPDGPPKAKAAVGGSYTDPGRAGVNQD